MKCCGTEYENPSDLCSSCGSLAIFSEYPISQDRWESAIKTISCGGLFHFTQTQLFADFLDEKSDSTDLYRLTIVFFVLGQMMLPLTGIGLSILLGCALFFMPTERYFGGVCTILVSILGMGLWFSVGGTGVLQIPALICATLCLRHEPSLLLSFEDVQSIQKAWFAAYPNNLFIEKSELGVRSFIPEEASAVLLVDQDILVDFFVLNGIVEQLGFAVMSTKNLPLLARLHQKEVFFLHGSGNHVTSVCNAIPSTDIGWQEQELRHHPSFMEFTYKSHLPVDLLSPKELIESTYYAIEQRVGILHFFERT